MLPVKYELDFYIPEDGILYTIFTSYISQLDSIAGLTARISRVSHPKFVYALISSLSYPHILPSLGAIVLRMSDT
jgi:hypothetical protein